uniref:Uncharacterized protein n=1 Tax=Setaria viridis TaxID=4556 RepID=A0A4U6VHE6_SETVI|nr:hypothetical protein SEVIR_3G367950v2 [Setaria viridis]
MGVRPTRRGLLCTWVGGDGGAGLADTAAAATEVGWRRWWRREVCAVATSGRRRRTLVRVWLEKGRRQEAGVVGKRRRQELRDCGMGGGCCVRKGRCRRARKENGRRRRERG